MKVKFSDLNLREQVAAINAIFDLKNARKPRREGFLWTTRMSDVVVSEWPTTLGKQWREKIYGNV